MGSRKTSIYGGLTVVFCLGLLVPSLASASPGPDFNGDGYGDLAVGAPYEHGIGSVRVLYGGPSGLSTTGSQFFTHDTPGMKMVEYSGGFGRTLAVGDFNHDIFDDLAVSEVDVGSGSPSVHIVYGSPSGLTVQANQLLTPATFLGLRPGRDTTFGISLATGKINRDRIDDLVIGAPERDPARRRIEGAAVRLLGGEKRLRVAGARIFNAYQANLRENDSVLGPEFGRALAIGRFNRGRANDLAIGAPYGTGGFGDVAVLLAGQNKGLKASRNQLLTTTTPGIGGDQHPRYDDHFGSALEAADFNDDRRSDLVIGVRDSRHGGAIHVLYGSRLGPSLHGDRYWTTDTPGIRGPDGRPGDIFGSSFSSSDLNGDGFADLVVGAANTSAAYPGVPSRGRDGDGGVHILYGSRRGLTPKGDIFLSQLDPGLADNGIGADGLGVGLGGGDFNADGFGDLVIGEQQYPAYSEDCPGGGAIHVLYGSPNPLDPDAAQYFDADSAGMAGGGSRQCASFGAALTAGR